MQSWTKWAIALLVGFAIIVLGFRFAPWVLSTFFVFNCLVLIVVVLLQSGKAGWRIGGGGKPDGIRSSRSGIRSFAGHYVVRGHVYGVRDGFGVAVRSLGRAGQFCNLRHEAG